MITIYGIHNCDVVQKALKWLQANNVPYMFHNYKEKGIDADTLEKWLDHLPTDKLINTRSTTYRELNEDEKNGIDTKSGAIALMMQYHSIIKRPLWDFGNGQFFLGWDEAQVKSLLP